MDQGTTLLKTYSLWQEKKFTLIGPETSIKSTDKHSFFYAPWIYYFLLPFMLVSNWEPLAGSFLFILLNLWALFFLFKGVKEKFNLKTALIVSIIFTFSPKMVYFSQFFWNPNFLVFCSSLLFYFWVKLNKKEDNFLNIFLSGLVIGFGLGNHYLFILVALPFTLWMISQKNSWKSVFILVEGILLGLLPLVVFEIKHNFYNLKTIFSIISKGTEEAISLPLPFHYYLSLVPLIYLLIALAIEKIDKKIPKLGLGITICFIIYSLTQLIPKAQAGYTMPPGWNYKGVKKASQIILKENKKEYNIVNLLSGDTRSYGLRFILTKEKNPPLKVNEYPVSDYLFILSYKKPETVITDPVWEISSFCPCLVSKKWEIQNKINLYLLRKTN